MPLFVKDKNTLSSASEKLTRVINSRNRLKINNILYSRKDKENFYEMTQEEVDNLCERVFDTIPEKLTPKKLEDYIRDENFDPEGDDVRSKCKQTEDIKKTSMEFFDNECLSTTSNSFSLKDLSITSDLQTVYQKYDSNKSDILPQNLIFFLFLDMSRLYPQHFRKPNFLKVAQICALNFPNEKHLHFSQFKQIFEFYYFGI